MKSKNAERNKIVIRNHNQTFIASTKLQHQVNLEKASATLNNVMYEPKQFPALIYCMKKPKVEIFIFESGKVVCTGAKEDMCEAIEELEDKLNT